MGKVDKSAQRTVAAVATAEMVACVKQVRKMSGKRARFVLTALLMSDQIALEAFNRALAG